MALDSDVYFDASQERINLLRALLSNDIGDSVMAHYIAGVAVESILRAYSFRRLGRCRTDHNLPLLLRESQFDEAIPDGQQVSFGEDFGIVALQWDNLLRFYSREELRSFLMDRRLHRKQPGESRIKGDWIDYRTRQIVNASIRIVILGVRQWKR